MGCIYQGCGRLSPSPPRRTRRPGLVESAPHALPEVGWTCSRWIEELRRRGLRGALGGLDRRRRPASPGAYLARRQRRRLLALLAASAGLALLLAGGALYLHRTSSRPVSGSPSIVVLPFANLSGDAGQDYFADGMTEEIQGALSEIPGLRVMGRTTTFALRGAAAGCPGGRKEARGDLHPRGERAACRVSTPGDCPGRGRPGRLPALVGDVRPRGRRRPRGPGRDRPGRRDVPPDHPPPFQRRPDIRAKTVDPEVYNQYLLARRFLAPSNLDGIPPRRGRVGEGHLPRSRIRTRLGHALDGIRRPGGLRE